MNVPLLKNHPSDFLFSFRSEVEMQQSKQNQQNRDMYGHDHEVIILYLLNHVVVAVVAFFSPWSKKNKKSSTWIGTEKNKWLNFLWRELVCAQVEIVWMEALTEFEEKVLRGLENHGLSRNKS